MPALFPHKKPGRTGGILPIFGGFESVSLIGFGWTDFVNFAIFVMELSAQTLS
jgi:hypothetical protein